MSKEITPKLDFSNPVPVEVVPDGTIPHSTDRSMHNNLGPSKFSEYERLLEEISVVIGDYEYSSIPPGEDLGELGAVDNVGSVVRHLWTKINEVYSASASSYTDVIVNSQNSFESIFERTGAGQYKIKDEITAVYFRAGDGDGTADPLRNLNAGSYLIVGVLSFGDTIINGVNIDTNNCTMIYCEPGTQIDYANCEGFIDLTTENCAPSGLEIVGNARTDGLTLDGTPSNYVAASSSVNTLYGIKISAKYCVLANCSVSGRGVEHGFYEDTAITEDTAILINCLAIGNERTAENIGHGFSNISNGLNCKSYYNGYSTVGYGFKDSNLTNPISNYNGFGGTIGYGVSGGKVINSISTGNLTEDLYQITGLNIDSSGNALNISGSLSVVKTGTSFLALAEFRNPSTEADANATIGIFANKTAQIRFGADDELIDSGGGNYLQWNETDQSFYFFPSSIESIALNQYGIGVKGAVASSTIALNVNGSTNIDAGTLTSALSALHVSQDDDSGFGLVISNSSLDSAAVRGLRMWVNSIGDAVIESYTALPTSPAYRDILLAPNGGDIGIGVAAPGTTLDVNGRGRFTGIGNGPTSGIGIELLYHTGIDKGFIQAMDRATSTYKHLQIEGLPLVINDNSGGDVGIGTDPNKNLDVSGEIRVQRATYPKYHLYATSLGADLRKWQIYISATGELVFGALDDAETSQTVALQLFRNGDMSSHDTTINQYGIGVNGALSSTTYALNINGSINLNDGILYGLGSGLTDILVSNNASTARMIIGKDGAASGWDRLIRLQSGSNTVDIGLSTTTLNGTISFPHVAGVGTYKIYWSGSGYSTWISSANNLIWDIPAGQIYYIRENATNRLIINGNGIGVNGAAASTTYALNVTGNGRFSGNIGVRGAPSTNDEAILIHRLGGRASIKAGSIDGYMFIDSSGQYLSLNHYVVDNVHICSGGGYVRAMNGLGVNGAIPSTTYALNVTGNCYIDGYLRFPTSAVIKIYLYSTSYYIGIESSTMRYEVSLGAKHSFTNGGVENLQINQYGIGVYRAATSTYALNVDGSVSFEGITRAIRSGGYPLRVDRWANDGALVDFARNGYGKGNISLSGETVSYNPFTGSHYGWSEQEDIELEKGHLMIMTGNNKYINDNPNSEIVYGISKCNTINDKAVIGSYLSRLEPSRNPDDSENPILIMAVGNGVMWVADKGEDLEPGDFIISSDIEGHGMKDPGNFPVSYIAAKVAETVNWDEVTDLINGIKHKKISVLYESFKYKN